MPADQGYNEDVRGGLSIGQAWGRITYQPEGKMQWPLTIESPYVLVDGMVEGRLSEGARLEMRTLQAKALNPDQADVWSEWSAIAETPGPFQAGIGAESLNRGIHGVYRFELRIVGGGTDAVRNLRIQADFENGVMSIPRLVEGRNVLRMRVDDASALSRPLRLRYDYRAGGAEASKEIAFRPEDFSDGVATKIVDTVGLERCNRVTVEYR
ncbi:MAG: hypothetical protein R2748_05350 [Bryobacterales bacterium]